ncbi:MAG: hypothetical protein GYA21_08305 [Myxococcales bacterium]|nr:hypothetical protein [Myxococcales bacterium]
MKIKKFPVMGCVLSLLALSAPVLAQDGYGWETTPSAQSGPTDRFYLGFSLAEGAYFSYDYCDGCDSYIAAPLEFEVTLGFRLNRFLYLDLAANWATDYYDYAGHDYVSYMAGVRPGIRLVFPLLFHRSIYLRAAFPLYFNLDDADAAKRVLVGLLLGVGYEIVWGSVGLFGEVDIMPYFVEVFPGYNVIPTIGRLGVSFRF